jgi:hypothetical protein
VFALAGILVYIALRFRLSFAVGAVVATIHDLLITLAVLAIFKLRADAQRHRGAADAHRLLDERHHRHLRPHPREHALDAPRQHRHDRQRRGQPDAGPDDDHGRLTMLSVIALYFFGGEVLRVSLSR